MNALLIATLLSSLGSPAARPPALATTAAAPRTALAAQPRAANSVGAASAHLSARAESAPGDGDLDALERDLKDSGKYWEKTRQSAVRKLAELGTPKAWELVIGALEQESGQVADEAELRLASLTDAKLAASLLGARGLEHKDAWVRLRAAELFGRSTAELDALALLGALRKAREPELRRMLLWTIERRALAQRIPEAARDKLAEGLAGVLAKDGAAEVRAQALIALGALQRLPSAELERALRDKALPLRCAAARVLGAAAAADYAGAVDGWLAALARDAERAVRTAALDGLLERGTRGAAKVLAERYELEQSPVLHWRLLRALQELSGIQQSWDAAAWRNWADALSADWLPKPAGARAAERKSEPGEGTVAPTALIGLPIVSNRVCVLIDLSGSVWDTARGGKTRKQIIDEELAKALSKLPADARFNLIPYTKQPHPWAESLQLATPANVKRALDDFVHCRERGAGNFWDAALLALGDPEVDTLLVLTDGAPTGGRRWSMELMVELLEQQNLNRRVRFDSVIVDAPRGLYRYWQELARRSGGISIAVAMAEPKAGG